MSRRKRAEEHLNHDRWLISYADFITLLFALFVVLYASAQVDKHRASQLAAAIQAAFHQLGVFDGSKSKVPLADPETMPFEKAQLVENISRTQGVERLVQPMQGVLGKAVVVASLKSIESELEKALAPEIRKHVVELKETREGLVISLQEFGFYDSGSAALRPSSEDAIDRLAAVLKNRTEALRIEGHTDDVPIHNSVFHSNWELSTARATEFIRLFMDRYQLQPGRLAAAGYAEYHPIDTNSTAKGRARNRRVDIVILAPTSPLFEEQGAHAPATRSALEPNKSPPTQP